MRKLFFLFMVLSGYILSGCSQLDLIPVSQKSVKGFYKTETHLEQATIGIYNSMRTLWVTNSLSYMLTESRSDNTFQPTMAYDDGLINQFLETPNLLVLNTAWAQYYNAIQRCNRILQSLPDVTLTDEKKQQFEGEARFGRALFYFDLVRLFGGVPLATTTLSVQESYNLTRSSVEEVYDQIIADLIAAQSLLPDAYADGDKGRATKWAAKGYLGKVYLFRSGYPLKKNEFDKAAAAFSEVINSGKFEFFDDYAAVYSYANEGGKQQVFSIQFKAGASGNGNPFPTRNASNDILPGPVAEGSLPFGGSPHNLFVSADLMNSFEEGDLRKEVAILPQWRHKSGHIVTNLPTCKKYQDGPVVAANDWDIDWIALGYTDVLMMYAECLNEVGYQPGGEAFGILNRVRERAGLAPRMQADIPDQQAFRTWIEQERRLEFCFENLRWFDLVRTDRAHDVMRNFLQDYGMGGNVKGRFQYIYPIPQPVRDITPNIEQNPTN